MGNSDKTEDQLIDELTGLCGCIAELEEIEVEFRRGQDREKHLQQELRLSGRLVSIGRLTAGVAQSIVGFAKRLMFLS